MCEGKGRQQSSSASDISALLRPLRGRSYASHSLTTGTDGSTAGSSGLSLPVGFPEALGKQQQGAGLVAELSRTPSMSCPESAHVESQQ